MSPAERLAALCAWYETLTPETLGELEQHYAAQAYFKDPFNEVRGRAAIARIFSHMFAQIEAPRFVVGTRVLDGREAMLVWRMHFRRAGTDMEIRGASHLRFDAAGQVDYHRDYWDAAEELYAKLPLIGALMRALARRLRAG